MWIQRWKAGKGIRYLVEGEAEYIGLQKEKEAWLRILGMLAGLFLCYVAIRNHQYYIIILGVAVFLASLMFKDMAVTEEGVESRYLMPGWHMENAWSWEEITHVLVDYKQAAPNLAVHIGRDTVHRIVVLNHADARAVKELALRMNPNIRVEDMMD